MKLGFYSTMEGLPWGGSEELWSRTSLLLQERGHRIGISFKEWGQPDPRLSEIVSGGARLFLRRTRRRSFLGRRQSNAPDDLLRQFSPDFLLITCGYHLDSIGVSQDCIRFGIPYAINLQSASDAHWMRKGQLDQMRQGYGNARMCFFLSNENREIIERNLAMKLPRWKIVDNPVNVSTETALAWPSDDDSWRLACVGRLHFASKGQDLVLRALSRPRWRGRRLHVTFWGAEEQNGHQLSDLIKLYGLEDRATVCGYTESMQRVWETHHGLLLTSRYEGLPMVTVEAMSCGRIAVVTSVGRNGDLVDDDETGFLARSATVDAVDEALDRAWSQRHRWQQMGLLAANRIRESYSRSPEKDFAEDIETLARYR